LGAERAAIEGRIHDAHDETKKAIQELWESIKESAHGYGYAQEETHDDDEYGEYVDPYAVKEEI
jgi:hypothetical protein